MVRGAAGRVRFPSGRFVSSVETMTSGRALLNALDVSLDEGVFCGEEAFGGGGAVCEEEDAPVR